MRRPFSTTLLALFVTIAVPGVPATAVPSPMIRGAAPGLSGVLREASLKLKLVHALGADARHVSVSISGDRALLAGVVEERSTQELAEEVALAADGIRDVENRIVARNPPSGLADAASELGDAALESRVKHALAGALGTTAASIEVEATDGVVSLRGRLRSRDSAEAAVERVRGVPGVRKVVDLLRP